MFFCDSIASCWMDIGLNCPRMIRIALLGTLLFGVTPYDTLTYATVIGTVIAIAALASYLPARRAARIETLTALRYE